MKGKINIIKSYDKLRDECNEKYIDNDAYYDIFDDYAIEDFEDKYESKYEQIQNILKTITLKEIDKLI